MAMDDLYNQWSDLKQKLKDDQDQRDQQYQASLQPGDETTPANTWQNTVKGAVGFPQSWQQTVAQQKYNAAQPQPMEARAPVLEASMGPEMEAGEALAQGAEKITPELLSYAQQIIANPKMPITVQGSMDMNALQKLRDAFGHVGPVIMKGVK